MKMVEYLSLSDKKKLEALTMVVGESLVTEDGGVCFNCGKEVDTEDYCFGCHGLICAACVEEEPHYSNCLNKPSEIDPKMCVVCGDVALVQDDEPVPSNMLHGSYCPVCGLEYHQDISIK